MSMMECPWTPRQPVYCRPYTQHVLRSITGGVRTCNMQMCNHSPSVAGVSRVKVLKLGFEPSLLFTRRYFLAYRFGPSSLPGDYQEMYIVGNILDLVRPYKYENPAPQAALNSHTS